MAGRRLSPEEDARWAELVRTVNPLRRRARPAPAPPLELDAPAISPSPVAIVQPARRVQTAPAVKTPRPVPVLDGTWEKAIRAGRLVPDASIDLHGHDLAAAHLRLDRTLAEAVRHGYRVLLVVTGKPRDGSDRPGEKRRGAIRAEIGDWIIQSPFASRIASVRVAHPRHGGAGALYIILRRSVTG